MEISILERGKREAGFIWLHVSLIKIAGHCLAHSIRLNGVTWMSADTTPRKFNSSTYDATTLLISLKDNSTLLALWRTYSSLDQHITASGQTSLPPPTRLFFPQVRVFTDPNPLPHFHMIRRRRVDTGFHPFLLKAAFPQLTVLYQEDWEDYHKLPLPFVIERIVVADREAAEAAIKRDQPVFSPAFNLPSSKHWWEPVRHTLLSFLSEPVSKKKVVTYIHRQSEKTGIRLRNEDHEALVLGLKKLERDYGYEIHIVSSLFDETDWATRMSAISKSTVCQFIWWKRLPLTYSFISLGYAWTVWQRPFRLPLHEALTTNYTRGNFPFWDIRA